MKTIKSNYSGFTLWELLLVMSLCSFISVIGLHLLHRILYSRQLNMERKVEYMKYQSIMESVEEAMDRRYLNPFSSEPWLVIESGEGTEWFPLKRLRITTLKNDTITNWKWDVPESEEVYIDLRSTSFLSDEKLSALKFKFPKSDARHFRDGIAIDVF